MATMDIEKIYFSIGEVSRQLNEEPATLRFWEREFPSVRPHYSRKGTRQYTQEDIDKLCTVRHLLRERGLSIESARRALKKNPDGEARRVELLTHLKHLHTELKDWLRAIENMEEQQQINSEGQYE